MILLLLLLKLVEWIISLEFRGICQEDIRNRDHADWTDSSELPKECLANLFLSRCNAISKSNVEHNFDIV